MRGILAVVLVFAFGVPHMEAEFVSIEEGAAKMAEGEFGNAGMPRPRPPEEDNLPLYILGELAYYMKGEVRHLKNAALFNPFEDSKSFPSINKVPYLGAVLREADRQKVDPSLILAVIQKESSFDPGAYSRMGAVGLMQVLPSTAKWLGLKDPDLLWNPETNIKYGVKYIRALAKMFSARDLSNLRKGDLGGKTVRKVIAAYNAGPGNVKKHYGVPPFPETRDYVYKVSVYFSEYKDLFITSALSYSSTNPKLLLPS